MVATVTLRGIVISGMWLLVCCRPSSAELPAPCRGPANLEQKTRTAPSAETWAALGGWFGEQRSFACAASAFERALRYDPNSSKLQYFAGLTLYSSGQPRQALAHLQRSIVLGPDELRSLLLEGVVLNDLGRRGQAENVWESALRIDPNSVTALDWLAKARIADGQFQSAIDLLKASPQDQQLTLDLAMAYSEEGRVDEAAHTLASALKQSPGDLRYSEALATVYSRAQRYQDASDTMRSAVSAHPGNLDATLLYAEVLVMSDQDSVATPLVYGLLASHPDNFESLYLSGLLEINSQDYAAAVAHLRAAEHLAPNHYDIHLQLGVALLRMGKLVPAQAELEAAIALDSVAPQCHFELAQVLRGLGKVDAAQEQLRQYQQDQQARLNGALAANKSDQAEKALEAGDNKSAVTLYREAVAVQPDDPILQYNLALALDQIGDESAERVALQTALKLRPHFAEAEDQLGYLSVRAGDSVAAEQYFREALATAPSDADAASNLGTLLANEGHDSEAELYFRSATVANPRLVSAWVNLAATLASESRFADAQIAVRTALKIAPKDQDAVHLSRRLDSILTQPRHSHEQPMPNSEPR